MALMQEITVGWAMAGFCAAGLFGGVCGWLLAYRQGFADGQSKNSH